MAELSKRIVVRSPGQCSKEERNAFVTVASKGEEVDRGSIERGAERAELLLWLEGATGLIAVAALKNPLDSYRRGVFREAGISAKADEYPLEFGYLYVEEAHQGNGYGPTLVARAIRQKPSESIFATVRADNKRMHEILPEHGFVQVGAGYRSKRDPTRILRIFTKDGSK